MVDILQRGNKVLTETALPVLPEEFGSTWLLSTLSLMKEALESQDDGAAIAAPQIGVSKRIFIIAQSVFGAGNIEHGSKDPHFVFINPEIVNISKKKVLLEEGCLSVRGYYGTVQRAERATIRAHDEHGIVFTRGASGLLAQVFQHEVDHLNGILFVARADDVWQAEYPPKKKKHGAPPTHTTHAHNHSL